MRDRGILLFVTLCTITCVRETQTVEPAESTPGAEPRTQPRTQPVRPNIAPFAGPCSIRISGETRGQVELQYDELGRLVQAESFTSWPDDTEIAWRENWEYDLDGHLVRHEQWNLVPAATSPADADLFSTCNIEGLEQLPAYEEWAYDGTGQLVGWVATGHDGCVPLVAERYRHSKHGLIVERWQRDWKDVVEEASHSPCVNERGHWNSDQASCDRAAREAITPVWRAAFVDMINAGPGAFSPSLRVEYGDDGSMSWTADGPEPSGSLSFVSGRLEIEFSYPDRTCQYDGRWMTEEDGHPIQEIFGLSRWSLDEPDWYFQWGVGDTLARISDFDGPRESKLEEEFEEGCEPHCEERGLEGCADDCDAAGLIEYRLSRGEIQFDRTGRITKAWRYHHYDELLYEYDYGCDVAKDSLANPGLALVALDEVTYHSRHPPQLFYMTSIVQPMAAPGLWGAGRGLSADLETRFAAALRGCR